MSKVNFDFTADNSDFRNKIKQVQKDLSDTRKQTSDASSSMADSFKKIGSAVGIAFGTAQLVNFAKQVATVRGEFQQLEVAYTTMLGSKSEADKLMQQSIEFAAKTPFDVKAVASGAKQLLAYGSAASDVIDEMKMLGNIAAGLSIPLNDMVYLFGTTRTQGRMYTQDLRQFMGRGIPLAEELAKQFGVTKDKVGELVTDGKVGFEEMAKALRAMTSEGGTFYNLMDEQSKTIGGQISNLEDAFQQMLNEIGQSSEGIISKVLSGASWVVENYEKVGKVLLGAVAAWGTYKAAVIAVAATNKIINFTDNIRLIGMFRKELGLATAAQQAFNMASKANVYVALASVLVTAATALITFRKEIFGARGAMEALDEATDEYNKSLVKEQTLIDQSFAKLNAAKKGTKEYEDAKDEIFSKYGQYLTKLGDETTALNDVAAAYREITKEAINAASARAIDKAIESSSDKYADEIASLRGKAKKILDKVYGDKVSEDGGKLSDIYYQRLLPVMDGYQKIDDELNKVIRDAGMVTDKQMGGDTLGGLVRKAETARREMDATIKKAEELYGVSNGDATMIGPQPAPKKEEPKKSGGESGGDKDEAKKAKKLREEVAKAEAEAIESSNKELSDIEIKAIREREERRIKAIQDGSLREQQMVQFNYDNAVVDASREYTKAIDEETKRQKDAYKALNKGSEEGFVLQNNSIIKNAGEVYQKRLRMAREEFEQELQERYDAEEKANEDYLAQYGTYQQRREAIAKQYARKIREATTQGEKDTLKAEMEQALNNLDKILSDDFIKIFGDVSKMTRKELVDAIDLANKKLKEMQLQGKENTEDYKNLQEQVTSLSNALRELSDIDWGATWQDFAKLMDTISKDQAELDSIVDKTSKHADDLTKSIIAGWAKLAQMAGPAIINALPGALSKAASSMRQIAEASNDTDLENKAEQLERLSNGISTVMSGLASGGIYGGAIAFIGYAINSVVDDITEAEVKMAQLAQADVEYANALQLINIETKEMNSLFGENTIGNAAESWKSAQKALVAFNKILTDSAEKYQAWMTSVSESGRRLEGAASAAGNSMASIYQAYRNNANANNGYASLDIWTVSGSGQWVLNIKKAQAYIEKMGDNMNATAKAELEQLIALQEAYDDAMEAADSAISSFTGSLATSLADAVWDGLVLGGDDAWSKWTEIGADAVANIGKQMLSEMIMSQYLEQYTTKLREALGQQDAAYAMSEVVAEIVNGFPQMFEAMGAAATTYKDRMAALGIDVTATERTGTTGTSGITATQESVDKQSGILTSIQGFVYNIDEKLNEAARQRGLQTEYQGRIVSTLAEIASETRRLAAMESALVAMRSSLNDISLHGVKING